MRYKKNEETALTKIYNASAKLITTTKYNELTNSDIIREANISRSTFYMYFKDKDQIFTHICDDIFDHIFLAQLPKEKHHDYSSDKSHNLVHMLEHSFHHFYEDKDLILAILNNGTSEVFLKQLRKRLKPLVTALIENKIIGNNDIDVDIKIHQYINGYTSLLQYYLRHKENMTPDEVTSTYIALYKY